MSFTTWTKDSWSLGFDITCYRQESDRRLHFWAYLWLGPIVFKAERKEAQP